MARTIPEEGRGSHCREGKKDMVQEGKEKTRRRGRGRSRRNIWTKSPLQSSAPEGQLPAGDERSDHKVAAAFPLREQRDLVIAIRDPKKPRSLRKIHYFCGHTREFRGVVFSRISIAQGYCLGIQIFPITIIPMGMEIPLGIWFKNRCFLGVILGGCSL